MITKLHIDIKVARSFKKNTSFLKNTLISEATTSMITYIYRKNVSPQNSCHT